MTTTAVVPAAKTLKQMLSEVNVRTRFEQILGSKAAGFISSIISEANSKKDLEECDPGSVIASAAIAASLDLPIVGTLGFAALVPYKNKDGKKIAQFQIMAKGWVQLAQRTSQYALMNAAEVKDGQLVSQNDITGEILFDPKAKKSEKVVGYVFYFKLHNGFEKYTYMTVEECHAHGKKYSKSYASEFGKWKLDFPAMALKTVVKRGISKWGPVQIDSPLAKAITFDQAAVTSEGKPDYIDATAENEDKLEKTYKTPEMTTQPKNGKKDTEAKPTPTEPKVATKPAEDRPFADVQIDGVAKTTMGSKTVRVVRAIKDENKYYLEEDEAGLKMADYALASAKDGALVRIHYDVVAGKRWASLIERVKA